MPNILLIGAGTALLVIAITAKVLVGGTEKANKSEKAQIMKRLLAMSDGEKKISGTAPAARPVPLSKRPTPPRSVPQKTTPRISQALRS